VEGPLRGAPSLEGRAPGRDAQAALGLASPDELDESELLFELEPELDESLEDESLLEDELPELPGLPAGVPCFLA
jgi:hypothetical protein